MGWFFFNQFCGDEIREFVCQPTLTFKKMTLTEMFYGTFVPPVASNVYTHRIGFSNGEPYAPPPKRVYDPRRPVQETFSPAAKQVYKLLEGQTEYMSAVQVEKKTKLTRNYCSVILATMFKEGLLTRIKVRRNKTQIYVYKVK